MHKWNPIQSGGMRWQRLEHRDTYNNMHEHKTWHEEGRTGRGTDSEAPDDAPVLVDSRDFHVCAMHQGKGSGALT